MNKVLLKMAILSVSLLTVMAGAAISPALGDIALAFPDVNETTIKLILTLPSVMIIPFIFVSSKLTSRFSKKHILFAGMLFYLVGGLGGGFVSSIELLLFCRAILGIGVGLMMPISTSLVADFFDGEERTTTMGQVSAANNLGGVALFLMSGVLAAISWRMAFSVYTLVIVAALIVFFFLPNKKPDFHSTSNPSAPLPKKLYAYGAAMFLIVLAFYSIPANMALYIQQEGIGSSKNAGAVISVATAAGFFAGLLLGRVKRLLQTYFIAFQLMLMGLGFLITAMTNNLVFIGVGVGFMGFGFGSILPIVFDQVSRQVPRTQTVQAMAIVTSMLFFGQFSSPIFLDGIGLLFSNDSIRFMYMFLSVGIFIVASIFFVIAFKTALTQKKVYEEVENTTL
ncbi:MFS transporter [Bacillus sp. FJAT-45350]|uniref:MFS transporter n=1 Tax=Bacillus sp. FJAT-45350 TaxID=2011014 RepID=UPI000BB89673|nr:MFS transporter [Bacillus sp. FJAT-45350]